MLLGLDLRGGVHFLYQVDLDSAVAQYLETYETDLRTQFRERQIRNDIRVDGTTLRVEIIEPGDMDRAEEIIRALDTSDQLMKLGQLTSRLIVDRTQFGGRPGFNVQLTGQPSASGRISRFSRTPSRCATASTSSA
jgi:preprotein translocase subunit SecD